VLTALLGAVSTMLVLSLGQLFGRTAASRRAGRSPAPPWPWPPLVQPARRRIQEAVDRRLNRRRYDAARTIEAFSVRLPQQTDLGMATEHLQVVHRTVEPATASLWLRPSSRRPAG
jgi:hypothetical protein